MKKRVGVNMLTKFSEKAQKAIVIAESIAFDLGHENVGSEHLFLSLLKMQDIKLKKALEAYGVSEIVIYDDLIRLFGKKDNQPFYMEYTHVVKKILESAIRESRYRKETKVSIDALSLALLKSEESVAIELLNKYHVDIDSLIHELQEALVSTSELDHEACLVNLNQKVEKQQKKVIGREKELKQLLSILSRKEKNNALIIGLAGVGKTALVEKLALAINEKKVPEGLKNKVIYELDLASIVAGTKYRGEFEEKLKKIVHKIHEHQEAIIFIDEIHNVIGAGGAEGAIDASNILKPYLARKEITCIGATTLEEYYQYFEKDHAMNRRFGKIMMTENTLDESREILMGLKDQYMQYHQLVITNDHIETILQDCHRYLKDKVFPDKAIDVLDLACVKAKFKKHKKLSKACIHEVVEDISGMKINDHLQITFLEQLVDHLESTRFDIENEHRPQGIYLFVGGSGVGKTETAKLLAQYLNKHLIRLDMSEFKEPSSLSKILGSSPGYVGYQEANHLYQELHQYSHSLILLDEVEKAHLDVLNLFLQIFDEGTIKDSHQRVINFQNSIFVMTSNAFMNQMHPVGFKKQKKHYSLESFFSKEFLNRIDEIIYFEPIDETNAKKIIRKELEKYHLKYQGWLFKDEDIEKIYRNSSYQDGVRQIKRDVKKYVFSQLKDVYKDKV